jgi:hypothetical protein
VIGAAWGQVFGATAALIVSLITARWIFAARNAPEPEWKAAMAARQS